MARTTHDRTRDHRGFDKATNIKLDGATATYADLDVLQDVISDIDDRVIAGGGGGGSAYTDLLTGDDSTFDGSVGSWSATGTGTTVTYDGAVGLIGTAYGSAKIHTTSNNATKGGLVSVPGTFLSGHLYEMVLAVKGQTVGGSSYTGWYINFGDTGASDFSDGPFLRYRDVGDTTDGVWHESDKVMLVRGLWTPSSNRTSVTIRIRRDPFDDNVVQDVWVLMARAVEIPQGMALLSSTLSIPRSGILEVGTTENGGVTGVGKSLLRGGASFRLSQYGDNASVLGLADFDGNYTGFYATSNGASIYGNQSGGASRRTGYGINIEAGPDYVGIYMGERSATEFEIWPDDTYDVILMDGNDDSDTTHFWFTENADGTEKSALNLLHHLKHGTADPSAGGGIASGVGSFYGRDNSGVGELWVKTGASNTAWTKVTIP